MGVRITLLMAVTTDPANRVAASPHSGGWSESFYTLGNIFNQAVLFQNWGQARARLLPREASVIGYRQQLQTVDGNRLLPGGSASGALNIPGLWGTTGDLNAPQDALMVNFTVTGGPQNLRHKLPCLPDSQVAQGEYQPDNVYGPYVTAYINFVVANSFAALVHDLSQPAARVVSFAAGVLTTMSATGAAVGDFVRFNRVYDQNGNPVKGSYLVTAVNSGAGLYTYTLANPPAQVVVKPNGTVRKDLVYIGSITNGFPNRLVIRKVGRPFVQYRGRRSKARL